MLHKCFDVPLTILRKRGLHGPGPKRDSESPTCLLGDHKIDDPIVDDFRQDRLLHKICLPPRRASLDDRSCVPVSPRGVFTAWTACFDPGKGLHLSMAGRGDKPERECQDEEQQEGLFVTILLSEVSGTMHEI